MMRTITSGFESDGGTSPRSSHCVDAWNCEMEAYDLTRIFLQCRIQLEVSSSSEKILAANHLRRAFVRSRTRSRMSVRWGSFQKQSSPRHLCLFISSVRNSLSETRPAIARNVCCGRSHRISLCSIPIAKKGQNLQAPRWPDLS